MKVSDIVAESLELYNDSVKKTMQDRKMDATGDAKKSLRVVEVGNIMSSVGAHYIEYLNRGSRPWDNPENFMAIFDEIDLWLKNKGLNYNAAGVARNIAENGSRIYRNRELGLKLEDKTEALENDLNEKLPIFVNNQIVTAINEALKG